MKTVHIVNPAAGKGRAESYLGEVGSDTVYITAGIGDAERYVRERLMSGGEYKFIVYGGDGTINEAVNGVMNSGRPDSARIGIAAAGSGNDFIRCFTGKKGDFRTDLIKYNGRYAVNMLNIGFDCNVVAKTADYKRLPLISGSFAYILGVADILCHKLGEPLKIRVERDDGSVAVFDGGEYLLCAVANGQYCGGGFRGAPLAETNDGLLDVMVVKKISRRRFISLVGDYQKGTHIDPATMEPIKRFQSCMSYMRCRRLSVDGMTLLCADGEVGKLEHADIEVVPSAVTFTF